MKLSEVHWYFNKSTNRQLRFKALQSQCGTPVHAILAQVPTRWLSMGPALQRLLEQWEPLHLFFTEERQKKKDKGNILSRLYDFFRRRTPRLYVAFYAGMLKIFENTNGYLQSDSARLHTIKRELGKLYRTLASSILKPAALNQGHPWDANLQDANIKAPEQRFIGQDAQERLDDGVDSSEKTEFFKNVTVFYRTALKS